MTRHPRQNAPTTLTRRRGARNASRNGVARRDSIPFPRYEKGPRASGPRPLCLEMPSPNKKTPLVGQRRPALPRTDSAVPSALGGLTSGFGMGPGVPPLPWPLTNKGRSSVLKQGPPPGAPSGPHSATPTILPSRSQPTRTRACAKGRARPISTARLSASRRLHLQPIDLVVYEGSYQKENSSWDGLPA